MAQYVRLRLVYAVTWHRATDGHATLRRRLSRTIPPLLRPGAKKGRGIPQCLRRNERCWTPRPTRDGPGTHRCFQRMKHCHDANYLSFHRFADFRNLNMADSVVDRETLQLPKSTNNRRSLLHASNTGKRGAGICQPRVCLRAGTGVTATLAFHADFGRHGFVVTAQRDMTVHIATQSCLITEIRCPINCSQLQIHSRLKTSLPNNP